MEYRDSGVVILAAGKSERMKELKALLPFDGKLRFIDRIISTYSGWGCREIIVVTNPEAWQRIDRAGGLPPRVTTVVNDQLELERFHSVRLGLGAITTSSFCFIQDVDNPFITPDILDRLFEHRSHTEYLSPVFGQKGGHPILLNRENITKILNWPSKLANLKEVLNSMECSKIEMDNDRVLVNINSPEEYNSYFRPFS